MSRYVTIIKLFGTFRVICFQQKEKNSCFPKFHKNITADSKPDGINHADIFEIYDSECRDMSELLAVFVKSGLRQTEQNRLFL